MRSTRSLPVVVAGVLLVGACGGGGESVDTGGGGGGGGGEGGTLVAAVAAQPDQFDPHVTTAYPSFQVLENVYDTLVVPNPDDLTFEPSLATDWTTSDDQLTWTFNLRKNVKFHDGSAFDAADVAYSFNRIIEDELQSAFRFATVKRIRAVDADTVEIALKEPTPNLLDNVGNYKGLSIIPEGSAKKSELNRKAIGTGPFKLGKITPGAITVTANKDYWGEGPFLDQVEFRFVSEATTALTGLRSGDVHWTDNIPPQQIESLEGDDAIQLERVPGVDYWYMSLNFEKEPFGNPQFREAVSLGIDREAITEAARFGAATPNQTAIPEGSFWHSEYAPYERDTGRAKQLVEDAGGANTQMGIMVTDEFPESVQAAQVIASQLKEVGIDVKIETEDFATWLDRQGKGDYDAFLLSWLGNLDPFGFYNSQHTCEGSNNYQKYCDKETDRLLNEAATETDRDRRKELYDQAARRIVDDNSYIYLYNPEIVQAWTPEVTGYKIRPDRAINFETVRLGTGS